MKSEMVVCSIYKLFKNGNSFTKESKKLERDEIIIPRAYVEDQNYNWKTLGLWHEIDEEKTEEMYVLREQERQRKIKQNKINKKFTDNLTNMLGVGVEDVEEPIAKPKKEVVVNDIDVVDEEIIEVEKKEPITGMGNLKVAYLEMYGKHVPVNKKNDIDWISDKVNNVKQ